MSPRPVLAAMLALTACHVTPAPIPISGDTARLAGQWSGEYSSPANGRFGSIVFTLEAGRDTARGDIIMIPADPQATAGHPEGYPPAAFGTYRSQLLTVAFVVAAGGRVSGRLDPYRDPECGCLLTTTFTGALSADRIEGTFRSRHAETGALVEGTWLVRRVRVP